jgi:hypothetical protein
MIENKKPAEVNPIQETRGGIKDALGHKLDKMLFLPNSLKTELKVIVADGGLGSPYIQIGFETDVLADELYISFFVDGKKEPITLRLGSGRKGKRIFLEEELGFNPIKTSFNYMIYPGSSK